MVEQMLRIVVRQDVTAILVEKNIFRGGIHLQYFERIQEIADGSGTQIRESLKADFSSLSGQISEKF
jgi:hypothetical protein